MTKQEKPTLALAREYIAKLQEISRAMVEEKPLKDNRTPADMWKLIYEQLGNVDRLIGIAQEQLRSI